jgi:ATP-dependent DNA helicase RecG
MPQAGLLGTIHYPEGKEDIEDFEGPMVLIPSQVQQWLENKLPSYINRSQMNRQRTSSSLLELVREAVVNALVHRDYDIKGAKCLLDVTTDTITIKSPGMPMPPITRELLQSFKAPMLSRNPLIHYVFAKMNLAEERGLGMKTLELRPHELGLPKPKYSFEPPYLVLTLYLNPDSIVHELNSDVRESLSGDEILALNYISRQYSITSEMLEKSMGFSERKAQRILKRLDSKMLVRRVGRGPATRYELGPQS